MNPVNLAMNTAMAYPWYGYVAIAVSVVLLVGLPLAAVIYGVLSARPAAQEDSRAVDDNRRYLHTGVTDQPRQHHQRPCWQQRS